MNEKEELGKRSEELGNMVDKLVGWLISGGEEPCPVKFREVGKE